MQTNVTRRGFLDGLLGASVLALGGCRLPFASGGRPIALQLWSINKIMWKTMPPEEVFAKIRAIGFDGVEFAGFGDKSAREIRKLLADSGLRGMGAHTCGLSAFQGDKFRRNLDFCAEAGIESFTDAWEKFGKADEWKRFGEEMGKAAETARAWNLPISFHNHFHEFTMKYDGVCAWDLVFRNSSPVLNPWDETVAALEADSSFRWYVVESECKPDSFIPAERNHAFLKAKASRY